MPTFESMIYVDNSFYNSNKIFQYVASFVLILPPDREFEVSGHKKVPVCQIYPSIFVRFCLEKKK